MPEYISREALLKHAIALNNPHELGECVVPVSDIEAAPAADVAEVVHGRWKEDTDPADGDLRCTHCGTAWPKFVQKLIEEQGIWTLPTLFRYCPRCGAKMDKEDET